MNLKDARALARQVAHDDPRMIVVRVRRYARGSYDLVVEDTRTGYRVVVVDADDWRERRENANAG